MIDTLSLVRFKCFHKLQLPIKPMTLLTGENGSGKSAVIQAFLFLKGAATAKSSQDIPITVGKTVDDLITVGKPEVDSIIYCPTTLFKLGVDGSNYNARWTFAEKEGYMSKVCVYYHGWGNTTFYDPCGELELDRLVTKDATDSTADKVRSLLTDMLHVGVNRTVEDAATLLAENDKYVVPDRLLCSNTATRPFLLDQASGWLQELTNTAFELRYVADRPVVVFYDRSRILEPYDCSGASSLLPIIVNGLLAKNRLLLIEHPEKCLHPSVQSKLPAFLTKVTESGGTVVVETHSDHVLNGVRKEAYDMRLSPLDILIYFFQRNDKPKVTTIEMDVNGGLSHWPAKFFDQMDIDLTHLLGQP